MENGQARLMRQANQNIIYVQDKWNNYILFTQEIKRSIVNFSYFIKGSFVHIIT